MATFAYSVYAEDYRDNIDRLRENCFSLADYARDTCGWTNADAIARKMCAAINEIEATCGAQNWFETRDHARCAKNLDFIGTCALTLSGLIEISGADNEMTNAALFEIHQIIEGGSETSLRGGLTQEIPFVTRADKMLVSTTR